MRSLNTKDDINDFNVYVCVWMYVCICIHLMNSWSQEVELRELNKSLHISWALLNHPMYRPSPLDLRSKTTTMKTP